MEQSSSTNTVITVIKLNIRDDYLNKSSCNNGKMPTGEK